MKPIRKDIFIVHQSIRVKNVHMMAHLPLAALFSIRFNDMVISDQTMAFDTRIYRRLQFQKDTTGLHISLALLYCFHGQSTHIINEFQQLSIMELADTSRSSLLLAKDHVYQSSTLIAWVRFLVGQSMTIRSGNEQPFTLTFLVDDTTYSTHMFWHLISTSALAAFTRPSR